MVGVLSEIIVYCEHSTVQRDTFLRMCTEVLIFGGAETFAQICPLSQMTHNR